MRNDPLRRKAKVTGMAAVVVRPMEHDFTSEYDRTTLDELRRRSAPRQASALGSTAIVVTGRRSVAT